MRLSYGPGAKSVPSMDVDEVPQVAGNAPGGEVASRISEDGTPEGGGNGGDDREQAQGEELEILARHWRYIPARLNEPCAVAGWP